MPDIINTTNNTRVMPDPDRTELYPGANEVEPTKAAELRALPFVKELARLGVLVFAPEPVAPPVEPEPGDIVPSLKGLPLETVKRLVSECASRAQLKSWLSTDGRRAVRDLLTARAIELDAAKPQEMTDA